MKENKIKGMAGSIPVFCAFDEILPVEEICPNPKNPNQHPDSQVELLAKIITHQGWRAPVTVSTRSGLVVRGHGRLMAAKYAGLSRVPVDFQSYESEESELADLVADNHLAELASNDHKMLAEIFQDIDTGEIDFELSGYTDEEYQAIMDALNDSVTEVEEDDVPEVDETVEPKAKRGDLYQLGRHRLLCGDSTIIDDIEKLMGDDMADMVFTDPPWNVNYGNVKGDNPQGYKPRTILNDFMGTEEFKDFMYSAFECMNAVSKDGCMTYVVMSAQEWGNMMLTLGQNNYHWSSTIIWNKDSLVLSRKDYHTKYEPIWYGWKEGTRLHPLADRKQSDVWDIPRPKKSELHPTMKPVELVARAIENSSNVGDIVLDLFGGSGTTLMAAEQTGRCARLNELDPKYVDVIIARWEQFTGEKAVLLNG